MNTRFALSIFLALVLHQKMTRKNEPEIEKLATKVFMQNEV